MDTCNVLHRPYGNCAGGMAFVLYATIALTAILPTWSAAATPHSEV